MDMSLSKEDCYLNQLAHFLPTDFHPSLEGWWRNSSLTPEQDGLGHTFYVHFLGTEVPVFFTQLIVSGYLFYFQNRLILRIF